MKTPFRTLTAEDLAETGSRGGLDTAATAQPSDGAKRLIEEESNSSMEGLLQVCRQGSGFRYRNCD